MTPEERVAVLRRGVRVLRAIEAERRAALPPPDRDSFAQLAAVRDVMGLADRVEMNLEILEGFLGGSYLDAVYAFDFGIRVHLDPNDPLLDSLEPFVHGQDARRDFHEFRALLHRYAADEFRPPESYFDIST